MADAASMNRFGRVFDRARLERLADWLVVAVVVTLPWSTSATSVCLVLWLLALIPTLDVASIRRELWTPAGGLPPLLWGLALLGLAWGQVGFGERLAGLGGYNKLLIIPLLLTQFRRCERPLPVLYGFLASCMLLLLLSWLLQVIFFIAPARGLWVHGKLPGVPVKDYIAQSAEFMVCAFALLALAFERARAQRFAFATALVLLAMLFLANMFYVSPGRTALVVLPILLVILGFREFGLKGTLGACVVGAVLVALAWASSPMLRDRVLYSISDYERYQTENAVNSVSLRLAFWKQSLTFMADAPIIGHGTGTMPSLFRAAAAEGSGPAAFASVNPHNQYFAVGIELGVVGLAVLFAMWGAHLALFRGAGVIPWIGLVIVLQNIVSSVFNSHLFDFFHGWFYVFGVGVLGGMMLRARLPRDAAVKAR